MLVKYGKHTHELSVDGTATVAEVKAQLVDLCHLPINRQILIAHGKTIANDDTISSLPNYSTTGFQLILMGSAATVNAPTRTELLQQKRIINDLPGSDSSKHGRRDGVDSDGISTKYRISLCAVSAAINKREMASRKYKFNAIETLANFGLEDPSTATARQILTSLSQDQGILHAMEIFQLEVGALCEMYPEGKVGESAVCVMGLNVNKGQKILLRIRTDDLKGFRKHLSIRKVLYHELAHNRHGDHDDDFYVFMRQIETAVNEFNGGVNASLTPEVNSGTRSDVNGSCGVSDSQTVFRLGGETNDSDVMGFAEESDSKWRERIRAATLSRHRRRGHHMQTILTDEDLEAEYNCGCASLPTVAVPSVDHEIVPLCQEITAPNRHANDTVGAGVDAPKELSMDAASDTDSTAGVAIIDSSTTVSISMDPPAMVSHVDDKRSSEAAAEAAATVAVLSLTAKLTNRINEMMTDAIVGSGDIGPVEKLTEVKDYLDDIVAHFLSSGGNADADSSKSLPQRVAALKATLSLLISIVKNAKDKTDSKYRQLRTSSGPYIKHIRDVQGCLGLIRIAGFQYEPPAGTLSDIYSTSSNSGVFTTAVDSTSNVVPAGAYLTLTPRRADPGWLYILGSILETVTAVLDEPVAVYA